MVKSQLTGTTVPPLKIKPPKKPPARKKHSELSAGEGLSIIVTQLVKDSGIADYHKADDEVTGNNRINNLQELVNASSDYKMSREGLLEFLENTELDRSMEDSDDNKQNAVTLITFHNTKGLEYKCVIMTGLEHGVFPREDKKNDDLEEERRLFYVGATRAMDELYLTNCAERRMYGRTMTMQPSLFLREIDKSYLQIENRSYARTAVQSFNPYILNKNTAAADREIEERAGYRRGQRIFHDNYGSGGVVGVRDSEDGPVVRVRFDTGHETQFNSKYQGRSYEKIGDD